MWQIVAERAAGACDNLTHPQNEAPVPYSRLLITCLPGLYWLKFPLRIGQANGPRVP